MTVQEFQAKYPAGTMVKSPHGIVGQCVSVPSQFAVENGWPELFGPGDVTAEAIWQNGVPGYQRINNQPTNYPSPGDFVFFSYNHVVLVVWANANTIMAYEQNDPMGSGVHLKAYSYYDVQGWFTHPSTVQVPQPAPGGVFTVRAQANVRMAPHVTSPVVAEVYPGTIQILGFVTGDEGTVAGHVSNQWGITLNHHYVNRAALN